MMRYPFLWTWISLQISYVGMLTVVLTLTMSTHQRVKRIEAMLLRSTPISV